MLIEQPLRHVDVPIGVDSEQMAIERGMMKLRQRDTIGNYWLPEQFVGIGHDVSRIDQVHVR